MKRMILGFIGAYVLVAACVSVTVSASTNQRLDTLTNWETIKLDLPFDRKDLEDGAYDGLLAIGTFTRSFFQDTNDTLGQMAMWADGQTKHMDRAIAARTKLRFSDNRRAGWQPARESSMLAKSRSALVAWFDDFQTFSLDTLPQPDLREPLKKITGHFEKNFSAIAMVASMAKNLGSDTPRQPSKQQTILGDFDQANRLPQKTGGPLWLCFARPYGSENRDRFGDSLYLVNPANCDEFSQD